MTKAYLLGVIHDATERKYTYRLSQKNESFIKFIAGIIRKMGHNAWTYKEGKTRQVYVVEFAKSILRGIRIKNKRQKKDYIRGYFDAEGSVPKTSEAELYIYFAQKNISDLRQVQRYLESLDVKCGKIHNPSKRADPNYWRFFVSRRSHKDFATKVGSWHPEKGQVLQRKLN
ncbi:MAG: LAGLIDADG family homing endonuclease [Candidatus Hadarchaeaceae archaeon]